MNVNYEGNPINFKRILNAIVRFKWTNLLIMLTFITFGIYYHITSKPVYESIASIQIKNITSDFRRDFFGNNIGTPAALETEIDILNSNYLLEKTLKNVKNNVSYFQHSGLKNKELYTESPFIIKNFIVYNPKIFGQNILIHDLGNNKFKLEIEKSFTSKLFSFFKNKKRVFEGFNKIYQYGQVFVNKDIALKIVKRKGTNFEGGGHYFNIYSNEGLLKSIRRNLTIEQASRDSSILKISYKDSIPKRAKNFVNTLVNNYLSYSTKDQIEDEERELDFVNKQLHKTSNKLENSENLLEKFKINNDISDIATQNNELIRKIGILEENLNNANISYMRAKRVDDEVKKGNYGVISTLGQDYPALTALLDRLETLKTRKEELSVEFTSNHPDVISVNRGIRDVKRSINAFSNNIKLQFSSMRDKYSSELNKCQSTLKQYPEIEKKLGQHQRVFEVNDHIYSYLLQKQSELSIERVALASDKKVIDYARAASVPLNKKLPFTLIVSLFLGMIVSLLHTIIRSAMDSKLKSVDDIHSITDIPIYGIVPYISDKSIYNSLYVMDDLNSGASEAFRAIRTNLNYLVSANDSKVILISSSMPNEGKTIVAANLASIIGMSDKKCIILSLDMRRPELHDKFSLPNDVGMSDILSGRVSYNKAVWEHKDYKNLHIITSGAIPPNPAELIESKHMSDFIEDLRKEYDYIIIDTPPINYVSDALSILKHSDLNLFVLKSEFSDEKYLIELDKILKKLNIKNSGIILNSVKSKYTIKKYFDERYIAHKTNSDMIRSL
jgi:capsular exopolysaccharide synthesis family protein